MSNLFIIGNGFDQAHGMPTKYGDFREYLKRTYPNIREHHINNFPQHRQDGTGMGYIDKKDAADFFFNIFNKNSGINWSCFEESLYSLDFGECFSEPILDKERNVNLHHTAYANENVVNIIRELVPFIAKFFTNWIQDITIPATSLPSFMSLINVSEDIFFSFNYTKTLESIYNVEKICHIHGVVGEQLIFGHGNDKYNFDHYMGQHIGAESELTNIDAYLRKNVDEAMNENQEFFEEIADAKIGTIYSYGFSYGTVDLPYIENIIRIALPSTVWKIERHGEFNKIKKILMEKGFKGDIREF